MNPYKNAGTAKITVHFKDGETLEVEVGNPAPSWVRGNLSSGGTLTLEAKTETFYVQSDEVKYVRVTGG